MKALTNLITLALIAASFNVLSQDQPFVGENSELLIGKTVTFQPDMGYVDVYTDSALVFRLFEKGLHTNSRKLRKYTFVVSGVFNSPRLNQKGLILKNAELGEVYYSYHQKDSSSFYLIIKDEGPTEK